MKYTATISIGGHTYMTTQYSPTKALKILTLLGKVLGGPLGALASTGGKGLLDMKLDQGGSKVIAEAVVGIFQNLDESKVDQYVKDILGDTTVNGSVRVVDVFNDHFTARLEDLFMVLKWVLEVNFGNFFKGLIAKGLAAKDQESRSQTTSSG